MEEWALRLNVFLQFNEYDLLNNLGNVSAKVAKTFAESEFEKYRINISVAPLSLRLSLLKVVYNIISKKIRIIVEIYFMIRQALTWNIHKMITRGSLMG